MVEKHRSGSTKPFIHSLKYLTAYHVLSKHCVRCWDSGERDIVHAFLELLLQQRHLKNGSKVSPWEVIRASIWLREKGKNDWSPLVLCLFGVDVEERLMEMVKWLKTFPPSTKHQVTLCAKQNII